MESKTLNLSAAMAKNKKAVIDISGYQTLTVYAAGAVSGTISLLGTNDGGDVTGISTESPATAQNFTAVQLTNLATGGAVTAIAAAGLYQLNPISFRYLQIGDGSTAVVPTLLVFVTKIR